MAGPRNGVRLCSFAALVAALVAGCIVVQPLEDYPESAAQAGRSGSSTGAGGESNAGKSGGAGKPSNGDSCTTNADCERAGAGEPYTCRKSDNTCARLKTEVCPVVLGPGDAANPNAIIIGAFATLSSTAPERNAIIYAHGLAIDELSGDKLGGLPEGPNGVPRPLVMVVCYNQDDKVEGALDHLIDTLEVPAIIATLKPGDLRRAYEDHLQSDVFYLSPVAVTENVAEGNDDGLIWNMLGQPKDLGPTYAAALRRSEQYLRLTGSLSAGEGGAGGAGETPLRVALVTTQDAFDSELAIKVSPELTFNGASVLENEKAGNFAAITVKSTAGADIDEARAKLVAFRPSVIISAASEVMTMREGLIFQTEAFWEEPLDGAPLPLWMLSPYNAGDMTYLMTLLGDLAEGSGEDDPQRRFIGVSIAGPEDTSAQFEFRSRLGALHGNVFNDTANYYDAVYLLAYAMYAAGNDEPLSGSSIARGMKRLVSGEPMPIGPNNILSTFKALAGASSTIEVESTLGPPSFEPMTGVRQIDGSLFCFTRSGSQIILHVDTLRYDRELEDFRETDDFCLDNFFP